MQYLRPEVEGPVGVSPNTLEQFTGNLQTASWAHPATEQSRSAVAAPLSVPRQPGRAQQAAEQRARALLGRRPGTFGKGGPLGFQRGSSEGF